MDERSEGFREAVGIFSNEDDLQAAIDELLSSGFHRAELSLLAGQEVVNEKLRGRYTNTTLVTDDATVPRTVYVSPEAIGDAQGGIVGLLAYAGAIVAAGAIVVSGGTILAAILGATLAGGTGGIVGSFLAKWLGDTHAEYLQTQIDRGGLLLWVRTRTVAAEERAVNILRKHSSRDAHVHTLPLENRDIRESTARTPVEAG
jgi:hypothetical protein